MKILFIHASAGAGHTKAAEAIHNLVKYSKTHQSVCVDVLDYTNPLFKKMYRNTYITLVTKFPWLWGAVFGFLDIPFIYPVMSFVRRIYNSLNTGPLVKYLTTEKFDVIVSTHFMANEVVSALKKNKAIASKLICVVTDFDIHRIWLGSGVDIYTVATPWTKDKALKLGIPAEKVVVAGIPTDEHFSRAYEIAELKEKLSLTKDVFTVLIATGSFGIGPIEEIIDALKKDFQVLVVCGNNKELYLRLNKKSTGNVKIYGLVSNMYELMAVSNAMVTKPGGLSISEALVSQLPMIFFNAIPGQETNNIKVLAQYGIGRTGANIKGIVQELQRYKNSPDEHMTAVKNTKLIASPNSGKDILKLIEG